MVSSRKKTRGYDAVPNVADLMYRSFSITQSISKWGVFSLEYQLLETFLVVSEVRNLTKASSILYKTQPTISNRIQQLEKEVGYALLVREKGRQEIELTPRGKQFLQTAQKIYDLYADLEVQTKTNGLTLHLSSIASLQTPLACLAAKNLLKEVDAHVQIYTYQTDDVARRIQKRKLDLALVSAPEKSEGVDCEHLFTQRYYVVRPCENPSNTIGMISINELDVACEVCQPWDDAFLQWHRTTFHERRARFFVDSYAAMKEFLQSPGYWAVLQESNVYSLRQEAHIDIFRLDYPPPLRICYLLTNHFTDRKIRPLIRRFRELLLEAEFACRIEPQN